MGRKIAFAVWIGNDPHPGLEAIHQYSKANLERWGYEVHVHGDVTPVDKTYGMILQHYDPTNRKNSHRFYTKMSDYLRVWHLINYLEQDDVEEVLYFDYDLLILKELEGWGTAVEMHFECDDGIGENVVKHWYRANVNCTYRLNKLHLPLIRQHFEWLQEIVQGAGGNPKFAYPMNCMTMFQDMYVEDHWLFGNYFDDPNFCTVRNVAEQAIYHWHMKLLGNPVAEKPRGVSAINAMGSRGYSDNATGEQILQDNLKAVAELDQAIHEATDGFLVPPHDKLCEIADRLKNARIRPNYGSHLTRERMKTFLKTFGE